MAKSKTRATDTDRTNTCQLLDDALGDGQLSMEEHRVRMSSAMNAKTLGDLQSVVADLQISSTATQPPKLKSPARTWGIAAAVVAFVVLSVIGWGLLGDTSSPSKDPPPSTTTPAVTTTARASGTTTATTPPPPQLLTLDGLSGLIASMGNQFGDTLGYELVVYPDYAQLTRPDTVNDQKTVAWRYDRNGWNRLGDSHIPFDVTLGDLGKFNVAAIVGIMDNVPQTLNLTNPDNTFLMIESTKDGGLSLKAYASAGSATGYISATPDGAVKQIYPPGS